MESDSPPSKGILVSYPPAGVASSGEIILGQMTLPSSRPFLVPLFVSPAPIGLQTTINTVSMIDSAEMFDGVATPLRS